MDESNTLGQTRAKGEAVFYLWHLTCGCGVNLFSYTNVTGYCHNDGRGVDAIKAFFEEYGLVLVVTVIATGMILFSNEFKVIMKETITTQWDAMTGQLE